jgi:hypothetical protein
VPVIVPDHEANVVWPMVHGITSLALSHRLPCSDRAELHTLLDLALNHWASGVLSGSASIFPTYQVHAPERAQDLATERAEQRGEPASVAVNSTDYEQVNGADDHTFMTPGTMGGSS